MKLKPWYQVVTPREDLRDNRPLDASEFAVHLDQVRDGRAHDVYLKPELFFNRTFLTKNLIDIGSQVLRRLSGSKTGSSAVFNMTTQFGGGKTHALTLLYHLARHGQKAHDWEGVPLLMKTAGIKEISGAATAVFVGTEFDALTGRGGNDGTPLRKTPWGEIAYQLGGEAALKEVAEHEKHMTAPGGDVIRRFLPNDKPCLILMDEIMNFVSRYRKHGMSTHLYNFLHSFSEEIRGRDNAVLVVSIPASELEMNEEDQADYDRLKKLLDRVGKAVIMSSESETSEIIRRRLFEWDSNAVNQEGRIILTKDALDTCNEYASWVNENKDFIPAWFPKDQAKQVFQDAYPFHPSVLSVFERKWQSLPRFQKTRGVLRLLALWVSRAYAEGYKGAHKDSIISLGTAPLDDSLFRSAAFEQLGEAGLEPAVATDICGKSESHAVRLDKEATPEVKNLRLHRKTATTIFFESNGGQAQAQANVAEIRLSVGGPEVNLAHVEPILEELTASCYYLTVQGTSYRFSLQPNLNKILSDKRALVDDKEVNERILEHIRSVFTKNKEFKPIFFPRMSVDIPDRPELGYVILSPEKNLQERTETLKEIEQFVREHGKSARTFKSGIIFCVAETYHNLRDDARKLLAWETVDADEGERLIEADKRKVLENIKKATRDVGETVWRTYKNIVLLGKENTLQVIDLGLIHSSSSESLLSLVTNRLIQAGEVEKSVGANFLVRNWPGQTEWSTKGVRDAFFASPKFARLLYPDSLKETIQRGVENGLIAYVGKTSDGKYEPFFFKKSVPSGEVEISDDMYLITTETAEKYLQEGVPAPEPKPPQPILPGSSTTTTGGTTTIPAPSSPPSAEKHTHKISWSGQVPHQKWMNFYTRVLAKFSTGVGMDLKLNIKFELTAQDGISDNKIEEARLALRELGFPDDLETDV